MVLHSYIEAADLRALFLCTAHRKVQAPASVRSGRWSCTTWLQPSESIYRGGQPCPFTLANTHPLLGISDLSLLPSRLKWDWVCCWGMVWSFSLCCHLPFARRELYWHKAMTKLCLMLKSVASGCLNAGWCLSPLLLGPSLAAKTIHSGWRRDLCREVRKIPPLKKC